MGHTRYNRGMTPPKTLLSGIQPTGRMHLGNYLGAVQSWVTYQDHYNTFLFIADLHALTTRYINPAGLQETREDLLRDILACGVDPQKACLFFQSDVSMHAELHLLFSMMTPLPWLERVPTYKDKITALHDHDLNTYGFLGYPLLQAADIALYQADVVPVGRDQLPHMELTREVIRRFNHLVDAPIFKEPEAMLTAHEVLPGTDGRKMSKSYGNTIPMSDTLEQRMATVMTMVTDPHRVRKTDPGTPEICPVFAYHRIFSTPDRVSEIANDCRNAAIGCVACKRDCGAALNAALAPIDHHRQGWSSDTLQDIAQEGARRARLVAGESLTRAKKALHL